MFGCECCFWNRVTTEFDSPEPPSFSLPSPIPKWPQGQGFATGTINLGDLEVIQITEFETIWKSKGVIFRRPVKIPKGYFRLGHYCHSSDKPIRRCAFAVRVINTDDRKTNDDCPALTKPLGYSLIWAADADAYFWLPKPRAGYKALGIVVTNEPYRPELGEVRCVREDLTDSCETGDVVLNVDSNGSRSPFHVWNTRPCDRGMLGKGVSIETFFCTTNKSNSLDHVDVACLKNLDPNLQAMPNLEQMHALIKHYGPRVYFHPEEIYMPSSVEWFFKNGARLCQQGDRKPEPINSKGTNLPIGGTNDGNFWIDLPEDETSSNNVKKGSLESAELYIHVKPAFGGTFTDIVIWVFCPFNGPATLKVGLVSMPMNKIGQHVGDWEHITLRVSNFNGELQNVYFSQHSGGQWVNASELEFVEGNKPVVYSSKDGHASFPHAGMHLEGGSSKLKIGIRNDAAKSQFYIDSSKKYRVVAAEYLGEGAVDEPCWLQYMREWGPTLVYDSTSELEKIINLLPFYMRFSIDNIFFNLFPTEIYGEEGPTGPKEKENWVGDERS